MTPKTDPKPAEHAADFLLRFRPTGRVNLAAIVPDAPGVEGRNFTLPAEADALRAWIDARNGTANLYFCPNEPREDAPHGKLRKEHIGAIHAVYTDHDPKGGPAELATERARLNAQAQDLAKSSHKPSFLLNSGGGMQYVWMLAAPLPVTPENRDAAEAQGRGLAAKLGGGDAVQNIDRLLRLPNTWNLPDTKKRAKGRSKAPARVFATGARYTLAELAAFAPPMAAPAGGGADERVAIAGLDWRVAERIPLLTDIPAALQAKLDAAIAADDALARLWAGEKAEGDTSRSGFDASLVAALKRLQFTPTEAAQILRTYPSGKGAELTERDFKRCWLRSPVKTAREDFDAQPESAASTDAAESFGNPIERLNKEYAYVAAINAILWERPAGPKFMKLEAFHNKCAPLRLEGKPLSKLWMESKYRREFDDVVFMPGKAAPARSFNLWRGFAYEPAPSMAWGPPRARAAVSAWVEHLRENVARGDDEHARWITGWFAHLIQRPGEKPDVALVLYGQKGTGKNVLIERVCDLLGRDQSKVTANPRYVVGNFNSHLERCLLLGLDEAFWSGDKKTEGQLKALITGRDHIIEHKGLEPYSATNYTRVAILGNDPHIVPASVDERRYAVFEVGNGRRQDRAFFGEMREGMESDDGAGFRLLLRYLLDFDLSAVDVRRAPNTEALTEQKHQSMEPFFQWWFACLMDGRLLGGDFEGWPEEVETDRLRLAFTRHAKDRGIYSRLPAPERISKILKTCARVVRRRVRRDEARVYVYPLPPLDECRWNWEQYIGGAVEWEPAGDK